MLRFHCTVYCLASYMGCVCTVLGMSKVTIYRANVAKDINYLVLGQLYMQSVASLCPDFK